MGCRGEIECYLISIIGVKWVIKGGMDDWG